MHSGQPLLLTYGIYPVGRLCSFFWLRAETSAMEHAHLAAQACHFLNVHSWQPLLLAHLQNMHSDQPLLVVSDPDHKLVQ